MAKNKFDIQKVTVFSGKFIQSLFSSEDWDHLFSGFPENNLTQLSVLPRELSFFPEIKICFPAALDGSGDDKRVMYKDEYLNSHVMVGMRRGEPCTSEFWLPNTMSLSLTIQREDLVKKFGSKRITLPQIKVWSKEQMIQK
jgi:hypothetical protein